jgi:hypothetical protein
MTPGRFSSLIEAVAPALAALDFHPGPPAPSEQGLPEGWHAWTNDWATVLLVATEAACLETTSREVELWARLAFGLPLRNRPRRDWYLLLAPDGPLAVGERLAVENTDQVVRRYVVEWRDGAWDLGRVAFLPLGRGGELSAVPDPAPLPEQAQKILDLYRGNGQAVKSTLAAIEAEAGQEADDAG